MIFLDTYIVTRQGRSEQTQEKRTQYLTAFHSWNWTFFGKFDCWEILESVPFFPLVQNCCAGVDWSTADKPTELVVRFKKIFKYMQLLD